ncbi:MAG: hypothetical protein HYW65_02990 [Candidatus Liptonbacteria bacterium]|nr:hypothetical protein [Candidatus Liptonbacteria bacterium]
MNTQLQEMFDVMMGRGDKRLRVYGGKGGNLERGIVLDSGNAFGRSLSDLLERHEYQARRFQVEPAAVMQVFTGSISGVSTGRTLDGLFDLPLFCMDVAENPASLEHTTITMGFGGSTSPTPLRFPAYVVPAMRMLCGLEALGLPLPAVRLISAQMSAVTVNGMNAAELWPATLTNFAAAKLFVEEFFPKVAHRLLVDFDQPLEGEYLEAATALGEYVTREGKKERILDEAFAAMERQGRQHGGAERAMLYVALHVLLSPDCTAGKFGSPWVSACHQNGIVDQIMITAGCETEGYFNALRRFLAENARKVLGGAVRFPRRSLQVIFGAHVPPYYPRVGELDFQSRRIESLLYDFKGKPRGDSEWRRARADHELAWDYDVLEAAAGGWRPFLEWVWDTAALFELADGLGNNARERFAGLVLRDDKQRDPFAILLEAYAEKLKGKSFAALCALQRQRFLNGT